MQKTRAVFRALGVVLIISLHLIPIVIGVALLKKDILWAIRRRQGIARAMLRMLHIRVLESGYPQDGNFLFICNHQSYMDPVIKAQRIAFLPVAKAEIADWPLLGFGIKVTGILFVKRENKESRADIRAAVRSALADGKPVLIYPEGTTSDGTAMLPLRPGAFQTAADLGIGVVPIALRYVNASDAWASDEGFLAHFLRCFGKKEMLVRVHYGAPVFDSDATALMEKTRKAIDTQLAAWEASDGVRVVEETAVST